MTRRRNSADGARARDPPVIGEGLSNKEIATRLNIEIAAVKNHVHKVLEKMHVHSRAAAAAHLHLRFPDRKNQNIY
jgi:transposase